MKTIVQFATKITRDLSFTYIISVTTRQEQLHLNPLFHILLLTCFLDMLSLCIAFLSVLYFLSTDDRDFPRTLMIDSSMFSHRTLMSSMMQALHLSNNGLKSLPSTLFKMCSQLSTLDLHGTEITMDVLRQVAALPFPTTTKRNYSILLEFNIINDAYACITSIQTVHSCMLFWMVHKPQNYTNRMAPIRTLYSLCQDTFF